MCILWKKCDSYGNATFEGWKAKSKSRASRQRTSGPRETTLRNLGSEAPGKPGGKEENKTTLITIDTARSHLASRIAYTSTDCTRQLLRPHAEEHTDGTTNQEDGQKTDTRNQEKG